MHCIRRGSHPPYPPFARGEKSAASHLFPPLRRGETGGFFECLRVTPGSSSRRLKTALKRSRHCGFSQELKNAFQECVAPDGEDIGMPRAGNLDETGRVR